MSNELNIAEQSESIEKVSPIKYYFLSYVQTSGPSSLPIFGSMGLVNYHPLQWLRDSRYSSNGMTYTLTTELISWQEISEEEYKFNYY